MDVAVIVPTHRRPDGLRRLLDALEAQTFPADRYEVVVVDDDAGLGPAVARNRGWRQTSAPLLAFVDDDCVPEPGWLAAGVRALGWDDRLGVVTGVTTDPPGTPAPGPWTSFRRITWTTPWFEGCNVFYRRAALEQAGGFDESIGWWGEDASLGWRVVDAGWRRDVAPGARVVHDVEERPVGWHVRHAWLEQHLVALAARHPGLRAEALWRPWAFRRESVATLLAVAGLLLRRPRAALPWLWLRRHTRGRHLAGQAAVDVVAVAGHLLASARHRTLVL